MKSSEIFDSLYDWVKAILPDVEVIQAYGNGTMPKGHFMMIDPIPSTYKIGQAEQGDTADAEGRHPYIERYRGTIDIWEVDGTDYLYKLIETLRDENISVKPQGLVIYNIQGPISVPNLIDGSTRWQLESRMTLNISWSSEGTFAESVIDIDANGVLYDGYLGEHYIEFDLEGLVVEGFLVSSDGNYIVDGDSNRVAFRSIIE